MTQTELFAKARRTDPHTSHDAAASVDDIRESQRYLLNLLIHYGPMTDEAIYQIVAKPCPIKAWNFSPSGARSRRAELVKLGLVRDSGQTKLTRSGRKTIVWEVVP